VEGYLAHRLDREAQVLAALAAGDRTPAEVVARVYASVDRSLHPAAELSVRAHLAKLTHEGRVTTPDGERFTPNPGRGGPIREGNPGGHGRPPVVGACRPLRPALPCRAGAVWCRAVAGGSRPVRGGCMRVRSWPGLSAVV